MSERVSICFIAHMAWGEMAGGRTGGFGGIQRQLSLMARWYAARGHSVSLLTFDEGQPEEVVIDGVRVIKMCQGEAGLPGLRFFHPRWTSLVRAMRRADAEVYYQNTAEYVTGQAAHWCRTNGRGFVFSVANDWDCEPDAIRRMGLRDRALYKYGIRHADAIVCQTRHQQTLLRETQDVDSVVIPMPSPPIGGDIEPTPPDEAKPRVVWVGRIVEAKRLELLLDLAQLAPEVTFDVAGAPTRTTAYSTAVVERARTLSNVRLLGRVEREQIPALYQGAACLCCTSVHEGFPNTFLEAWCQGIPVVSTFDPDGLIAARKLGGVANDADGLLKEVRRMISRETWRDASMNGRAYYLANHEPGVVIPKFEEVFLNVARRRRRALGDLQASRS
jgi:glycosyltransferase involved in cell wall biosynthesis